MILSKKNASDGRTFTVGLFGNSYWSKRLALTLEQNGIRARCLYFNQEQNLKTWSFRRWLSVSAPWSCNVLHVQGWPTLWNCWVAARTKRVPVILHWIGSDVSSFLASPRWSRVAGPCLNALVSVHLAVSEALIRELRSVGIYARYQLNAATSFEGVGLPPLPATPRALAMLRPDRFEFYGGTKVIEMAAAAPDIHWLVLANDGKNLPKLPNMEYLGYVNETEMDVVYQRTTVLVRLPQHDGMPNMILEALARGRHVVWTHKMPYCRLAKTTESALREVRAAIASQSLNLEGAAYVRREFDAANHVKRLCKIYAALTGTW